MYDGEDPLDVWDRSVKPVNGGSVFVPYVSGFIFDPHVVLCIAGILSGQSKPSLKGEKKATSPRCWSGP